MKTFALSFGEAFRGIVALTLIALAVRIVAPVSLGTALVMVVGALTLAASGAGRPVLSRARR